MPARQTEPLTGWPPRVQVLYDGSSVGAVELMRSIAPLTLLHLHPPWASEEERQQFAAWQLVAGRQWGGRPAGNYDLMVKQGAAARLSELVLALVLVLCLERLALPWAG